MIPNFISSDLFDYEIIYTKYAGHAAELTKQAVADGINIVVAVGGDGTVNEVARSLTHSDTALGIVPCGSGNGLARHLYIPMNPDGALQIIAECNIETLDYGMINDTPFFCTCGVGFDAFVSKKFAESGKRGLLTYLENTLKEGLKYKPETYEINIDGEEQTHKAFLIACANASQYGNNVYIAPAASMSDGLMDVTIMEPFTVLESAQIAIQLFNKNINKNSHIKTFKCKRLQIKRNAPGVIHFDGDPKDCGECLDIRLIDKGIKIVVNTKEQESQSALLQTFNDFYENMQDGISLLREDFKQTNQRIKTINKDLLKKLKVKN